MPKTLRSRAPRAESSHSYDEATPLRAIPNRQESSTSSIASTSEPWYNLPNLTKGSLPAGCMKDDKLTKDGLKWIADTYMLHLTEAGRSLVQVDIAKDPSRKSRRRRKIKTDPYPTSPDPEFPDGIENYHRKYKAGKKWYCFACDNDGYGFDRAQKHEVSDVHRNSIAHALGIFIDQLPELDWFYCSVKGCTSKPYRRRDQILAHLSKHHRDRLSTGESIAVSSQKPHAQQHTEVAKVLQHSSENDQPTADSSQSFAASSQSTKHLLQPQADCVQSITKSPASEAISVTLAPDFLHPAVLFSQQDPWDTYLPDDHPSMSAEVLFERFCLYPELVQ